MRDFPEEVRNFARIFVKLQQERHQADYNPGGELLYKSDVLATIKVAESAISQLDQEDREVQRDLVAHVLFKRRN